MVGQNMTDLITFCAKRYTFMDSVSAERILEVRQDNPSLLNFLTCKIKTLKKVVFHTRQECDLLDPSQTLEYFQKHAPDFVIHLAAKVGGLFANMDNKYDFYRVNSTINNNVIWACHTLDVKRVVCVLSTCIYPDKVPSYPIQENWLHDGPPHPSNEGYAMAKRMCEV